MAEDTTTTQEPTQEPTPEPQGTGGTDWKAEARKWEARAKSNNDRIKELEAKATRLDELEAANKSDIERANDAATKASAEAADWKAKYEELDAARQRDAAVRDMARKYGVEADLLARMTGDVEDNAKFLQAKEASRPKFGSMSDGGEKQPPVKTLAEALKGVKSTAERIRIREEFNAKNHNR